MLLLGTLRSPLCATLRLFPAKWTNAPPLQHSNYNSKSAMPLPGERTLSAALGGSCLTTAAASRAPGSARSSVLTGLLALSTALKQSELGKDASSSTQIPAIYPQCLWQRKNDRTITLCCLTGTCCRSLLKCQGTANAAASHFGWRG